VNEVTNLLNDKAFLDNLYGFAYRRTNNSYEAEDLCSDIILAVISAARRNSDISNAYAFVWTIARRVYADYSQKRKVTNSRQTAEYSDTIMTGHFNSIDAYMEDEDDKLQLRRVMREIMFLSKIYRDVCVMYYLDEMKVGTIARQLGITENAVKQRLHSARETIRKQVEKGVEKMEDTNLTLQPVYLAYIGTGNPTGNSPFDVASRTFSKNLIYLCKNKERTVKELSEMLGMPMPWVEEEVLIQLHGENGYYGTLRKTESDKYTANVIIIDYDEYMKIDAVYRKYADIIATKFVDYVKKNEQKLLAMPFLNKQTNTKLIAWPLAARVAWSFAGVLKNKILEKHFSDVEQIKREYTGICIAFRSEQIHNFRFWGCNGTNGFDVNGYKRVFISTMGGPRLQGHFYADHNISQDTAILLTVKAIDGLPIASLSESEKEVAARAIEVGYLNKEGDMLYPKILVSEGDEQPYWDALSDFLICMDDLVAPAVDEMYSLVKKYVPKHLMGDTGLFIELTSAGVQDGIIEKCIELGVLTPPPEGKPSTEGVVMVVTK